MMYGSLDMVCDKQNFLSFWIIFCPFTPPYGPRKSKFWKYENNTWRYYHFTNVYHKWQSYNIWFLRYEVQWTEFLSFWTIFRPFSPQQPKKSKLWKTEKKHMELSFYDLILHMCTKNYDQMMYSSWDMVHEKRTDGQTDGQKKWHIEVGAPPKKRNI